LLVDAVDDEEDDPAVEEPVVDDPETADLPTGIAR
jgi:hypothetical protein